MGDDEHLCVPAPYGPRLAMPCEHDCMKCEDLLGVQRECKYARDHDGDHLCRVCDPPQLPEVFRPLRDRVSGKCRELWKKGMSLEGEERLTLPDVKWPVSAQSEQPENVTAEVLRSKLRESQLKDKDFTR